MSTSSESPDPIGQTQAPEQDARLGKDVRKHAIEVAEELGALEKVYAAQLVEQLPQTLAIQTEVSQCQQLADDMEQMLLKFQQSLADVSRGIMHIQQSTSTMTLHLQNRKVAQQALDKSLTKLLVPPSKILQSAIDDAYMDALAILHAKLQYARHMTVEETPPSIALQDILERLRLAAATRVRKFLLEKIGSLSVPNTNVQIIQQAVLLRYQPAFRFLRRWHVEAAAEILQAYINAMMLYYVDHFDMYSRGLWRLLSPMIEKSALTVWEDAAKSCKLPVLFTAYRTSATANQFNAEERAKILSAGDSDLILAHVAEEGSKTFPLERILRSIYIALRDNACTEYVFILQFFIHRSEAEGSEIFAKVFQPTLKSLLADLRHIVEHTYDVVGLLVSVRVLEQIGMEMERRQVPILDNFLQEAMMTIWPKYQLLVDRIVRNMREHAAKKKVVSLPVTPHSATIRYTDLVASIVLLSLGPNDGVVQNSLLKLRSEFTELLEKLASTFQAAVDRHAFYVNNLATMLAKLTESARADEPLLLHYQQVYEEHISGFVEQVLTRHFPELLRLAQAVEYTAPRLPDCDKDQLASISQDFNKRWTNEIGSLRQMVQQRVSNDQAKIELMQAILSRLVTCYTHFYMLLERTLNVHTLDWRPLGVQTLMVDVKRFAL